MNTWLKGLLAALIGGAANAVTTSLVAPETFNFGNGLGKLASVAGASAIVSAAMYLKQSPIPPGPAAPPSKGSGILSAVALLLTPCSLLFLGGCASLTPAQTTALTAAAPTLASAITSASGPKTNADITAALDAAQVIYQAYEGQPIPASSISTGVTAVDNVLQAYTSSSSPVTAQDISTIGQLISAFAGSP